MLDSVSTCREAAGRDVEGLQLEPEGVDGEAGHDRERLLRAAHVRATHAALQEVQRDVSLREAI